MAIESYADLKAAVESFAWNSESDFVGSIPTFIQLAEQDFLRKLKIRPIETVAALTTSADTAEVALPTGYRGGRTLYVDGSVKRPLSYMPPQRFYGSYAGNTSGEPKAFTIVAGNLVLGPTPGASSYTLKFIYSKAFEGLSSTNASNNLLERAPDLYLKRCLMYAFEYMQDEKRADRKRMESDLIMRDMKNEDVRERTGVAAGVVRGTHQGA